MSNDLTRRAFLRRAVPCVVAAPFTPLWAQWLRDEMRKLVGRRFWVPPRGAVTVTEPIIRVRINDEWFDVKSAEVAFGVGSPVSEAVRGLAIPRPASVIEMELHV